MLREARRNWEGGLCTSLGLVGILVGWIDCDLLISANTICVNGFHLRMCMGFAASVSGEGFLFCFWGMASMACSCLFDLLNS